MTARLLAQKFIVAALGLALLVSAGWSFYRSRHLREPVVLGPGVTAVKHLGDYFEPIRGTANDCNVYVLEGKEPGATFLVLGGTHAEEPAGRLVGVGPRGKRDVEKGRLLVVLSANRSASTVTRAGRGLSAGVRHQDCLRRAHVPNGRPLDQPARPVAGSRGLHPLSQPTGTRLRGRPQLESRVAGAAGRHAHREDGATPSSS